MDLFDHGSGKRGVPLHFRWLAAIEDGGTSLYRTQDVEKYRFSTAC